MLYIRKVLLDPETSLSLFLTVYIARKMTNAPSLSKSIYIDKNNFNLHYPCFQSLLNLGPGLSELRFLFQNDLKYFNQFRRTRIIQLFFL